VEREEYVNFFRAMTKSFDEPLGWAHFKAEGDVEFK
jgi:HSP90 family molecular chaperone